MYLYFPYYAVVIEKFSFQSLRQLFFVYGLCKKSLLDYGNAMAGYRPINSLVKEKKEETNLLSLALRQCWEIPDAKKQQLVESMLDIANNEMFHPSLRAEATKNVIAMVGQNMKMIEVLGRLTIASTQQSTQPIADESEVAEGIRALIQQVPDTVTVPDEAIIDGPYREVI